MKCPYCAEEIQDEAILCRFCGARKEGEDWSAPPAPAPAASPAPAHPARSTIAVAGVLFLLSALWEGYSLTSEVPLCGALRGGAVAIAYHATYVALFLAMGFGLLAAKRWGYRATIAATACYTLDKVLYLFDDDARKADLAKALHGHGGLLEIVDREAILQVMRLSTAIFILCWWGFLLYLYLRRDFFERPAGP